MGLASRLSPGIGYLKRLTEAGFEDIHLLQRATAERVLTEKRIELLRAVETESVESVRELSRIVDRDVGRVSEDLKVLYEAEVINYEQNGRAKRPVLAHDNIFVQPVVYEGHVLKENN